MNLNGKSSGESSTVAPRLQNTQNKTGQWLLPGKVIIVTGGGKGLGREIALLLSRGGGRMVLCGRGERALAETCEAICRDGGQCEYRIVDVTQKSAVERFIAGVARRYGRIDVLINNAGWCGMPKIIERVRTDEYERYFAVNVSSVFYFLREAIPIMKKQRSGIVINIASRSGRRANSSLPLYSAAKFAVQGLTQAVGKSLIGSGVSCISISPAGINTSMRAKIFGKEDASKQQDPTAVAAIVARILEGDITVSNGGDVEITGGKVVSIRDPL